MVIMHKEITAMVTKVLTTNMLMMAMMMVAKVMAMMMATMMVMLMVAKMMMATIMMATMMMVVCKDGGGQGAAAEGRWPLPSYVFDLPTSHLLANMMIFLKNIAVDVSCAVSAVFCEMRL